MTRSLTLPHGLVRRARIILACAAGESQVEIAKRLGASKMTVSKWRHRFHHQGTAGLYDQQRPGRPRNHDDERVAEVIHVDKVHGITGLYLQSTGSRCRALCR